MEVVVECLCSKKYSVVAASVPEFVCQACKRTLQVPSAEIHNKLEALRKAWRESGTNIRRLAGVVEEVAALRHEQTLPLLSVAAQTGIREVVNGALVGLCRYEGPGQDLLFAWLKEGTLGVTRLISAFKEAQYADGPGFLCDTIDAGKLKENQIAEAADYLGESGTPRALATLKAVRRAFPGQAAILDSALARLSHVDESATAIPESARAIPGRPSQQLATSKKGCMGLLMFGLLILLALAALTGCDEVKRKEFTGLLGTVGYPPIAGCTVDIYDASRFESLDSIQGRLTQTTTDFGGRFIVEIGEINLGRPLIIVARPTTGATYLDYGAPGSPLVAFSGNRRPWVSVIRQWQGGEDIVTVSPATTLAFECIMRLPSTEVGQGAQRFDARTVSACNIGVLHTLGIGTDPAEELAAPPLGGPFPIQGLRDQEKSQRCTAYTYAELQLALAANSFITATTAPADSALDFYEALFDDAQDGVIDGQYYGSPIAFFVQAGAPAITGLEIDGSSRFCQFLASLPLSPTDQAIAGAAQGGQFAPPVATILTNQAASTGAIRPPRLDSCDVQNYPFSGNVTLTLRGAGFRHADIFQFKSNANGAAIFEVNLNSALVDGQFLFHSSSELRMRIPDFALTTRFVPNELKVATGADFREVTLSLNSRVDPLTTSREFIMLISNSARVTNRTALLLVSARIGRLDAGLNLDSRPAGNNVNSAATDPAALVPGVNDVYALRLRVANPAPDAVNNTGLNLTSSIFLQNNLARIADTFGGALANRAIIFESAAALVAKQVNLAPGGVAEITYPFVFLDTAMPADLSVGVPVSFNCVLSGVSQGAGFPTVNTNDVVGFSRIVSLAPAMPANTPEITALAAPTAPASVTAGNAIAVQFTLGALPRAASPMRDAYVESLDLVITFNGQTINLRLADSFTFTPMAAGLSAVALTDASGAEGFPRLLTQISPSGTITLTLDTSTGITGPLTLTATARLVDTATGNATSSTSPAAIVSVNP